MKLVVTVLLPHTFLMVRILYTQLESQTNNIHLKETQLLVPLQKTGNQVLEQDLMIKVTVMLHQLLSQYLVVTIKFSIQITTTTRLFTAAMTGSSSTPDKFGSYPEHQESHKNTLTPQRIQSKQK